MFILVRANSVYAATSHLLSHRVLNYPQLFLILFPCAPRSWSFSKALWNILKMILSNPVCGVWNLKSCFELELVLQSKKSNRKLISDFRLWKPEPAVPDTGSECCDPQGAAHGVIQSFQMSSCTLCRMWTLLCVTDASSDRFWTFIL